MLLDLKLSQALTACCSFLAISLSSSVSISPALAAEPEKECQRLASSPYEPDNTGGVEFDKIDVEQAYAPCSLAAKRPSATAADQFRLGRVLHQKKSYVEAIEWYKKAAERNYFPAFDSLAYLHNMGYGVSKNDILALQLALVAAGNGHALAQYRVGYLYYFGAQGIAKNIVEAEKWIRKSAAQGHPKAQHMMGVLYDRGEIGNVDRNEALTWYRKAAEKGISEAQERIDQLMAAEQAGTQTQPPASSQQSSPTDLAVGLGALILLGVIAGNSGSETPPSSSDSKQCTTDKREVGPINPNADNSWTTEECPSGQFFGYGAWGRACFEWYERCE